MLWGAMAVTGTAGKTILLFFYYHGICYYGVLLLTIFDLVLVIIYTIENHSYSSYLLILTITNVITIIYTL